MHIQKRDLQEPFWNNMTLVSNHIWFEGSHCTEAGLVMYQLRSCGAEKFDGPQGPERKRQWGRNRDVEQRKREEEGKGKRWMGEKGEQTGGRQGKDSSDCLLPSFNALLQPWHIPVSDSARHPCISDTDAPLSPWASLIWSLLHRTPGF